jgi:DNA-binding MarR family transcriptional regulator
VSDDDEVDQIVDAWAALLPEVDFSPLDVMSRLRRVAHELGRLRAAAFRGAGLETWEFDVLAALRRTPEPHELSPVQLSAATMIGTAAMSNRLENLVLRGLVGRRDNPYDRRSRLVVLTPQGLELVDRAMVALVEREAEALAVLSRSDQAQLVRILRTLGDTPT